MTTVFNFASQPSDITFAEKSHAQNTVMVNEKELHSYKDEVYNFVTYNQRLEEVQKGSVSISMSDLLSLLSQIIESSKRLYEQMLANRNTEALATCHLAIKIAGDKSSDAQRKFGITLAASTMTMAITTATAVKNGQCKTLKDKHVTDLTNGKNTSVKSLDSHSVNKFTSDLNEARLAKYRSVSQMSEMAGHMVGNVNEIQHADEVRKQEETQAIKELKEKFDGQLDQFIQSLQDQETQLNNLLDSVNKASLPNNR